MRGKNIAFFVGICVIIGWITGSLLMQIYGRTRREPIIPQYNDNTPVVALTFDDGPNARYTPQVLDILYEYQAPSTFFLVGEELSGKEWLVEEIVASGHEIGCHTNSHRDLTTLDTREMQEEIQLTQEKLSKILTDYTFKLVRPPYGRYNQTVQDTINLPLVLWLIDSGDWDEPDADAIYTAVVTHVQDGDIVVFHDDNPQTVKALERILPALKEKGFRFLTVSQMCDVQ